MQPQELRHKRGQLIDRLELHALLDQASRRELLDVCRGQHEVDIPHSMPETDDRPVRLQRAHLLIRRGNPRAS
jgi:hypothetical protein